MSTPGVGRGSYTAYGPVGTGPYVYSRYMTAEHANKMVKNVNYWRKAALEAAGTFQIQTFYVQHIPSVDTAVAFLQAGYVDVSDSQYHLETRTGGIQQPWGSTVSYDALGVQELGFNMQHPVFGTGGGYAVGNSGSF